MPAQSRLSRSTSTPGPAPEGQAAQSGGLGNAGLVERLLGAAARPAPGAALIGDFARTFSSIGSSDPATASVEVLSRFADLGEAAPTSDDALAAVAPALAGPEAPTVGPAAPAVAPVVAGPEGPTVAPAGGPAVAPAAPAIATPKAGTAAAAVYDKHKAKVGGLSAKMTPAQLEDLAEFKANWVKNKAKYEAVAAKAGVPAPLVAAIHWRESTGNFKTYLHQGDPLGKKATHVPTNIPIFTDWEEAAVHALTMADKKQVRDDLGMTKDTKDAASMATYSEFYNGLGYHNKKRSSPYVYSGTDEYKGGKYVRDRVYSAKAKDQQLGTLEMVASIGGMNEKIKDQPATGPVGWDSVIAGRTLQRGARGPLVKELQTRLATAGFPCGTDSRFGKTVEKAVKDFQAANKIEPADGIVGKDVATRLTPTGATPPAGAGTGPTGPAAPGPATVGPATVGPAAPGPTGPQPAM